jgi:GNAT superfamily N-acetyltransferase
MSPRLATDKDLPLVHALILRTLDDCYTKYYTQPAIEYFKEYHSREQIIKRHQSGTTFVIENEKAIIGTGNIEGMYVSAVFIERSHQVKGYGRLIMESIENYALKNKIHMLKLDSTPGSLAFYLHLNYRLVKLSSWDTGRGECFDYFEMEKWL